MLAGHGGARFGVADCEGRGHRADSGHQTRVHLEEDVKGADIALSAADVVHLDELFAPANIAGKRYPPALAASIDSD